MTSSGKAFVVKFVRRTPNSARQAFARRSDEPDGWLRIKVRAAERMLHDGSAEEEVEQ